MSMNSTVSNKFLVWVLPTNVSSSIGCQANKETGVKL